MSNSDDEKTVDGTDTEKTAGEEGADGDAPSDQLETASMNPSAERNETVDPSTQKKVLERDRYRCRACNAKAPAAGGLADLEVHHADRDPDDVGEHDLANLLTLCRSCHSWHHKRGKSSDVPIRLTEADDKELLSHDYEILRILNDNGPLRTGAIAERLTAEMSLMAVRERLWHLGGLDNKVPERTEPLVTKDIASQEWGLLDDIVTGARGHIPDDHKLLVQRTEDELVRRALDRGCDRQTVMEVFDVSRRGTIYKEKRSKMYDFPIDAFSRGGRPRVSKEASSKGDSSTAARGPEEAEAIRNAAVRASEVTADGGEDPAAEIVSDTGEPVGEVDQEDAVDEATDAESVQQLLEEALDALRDDTEE
ncbi:hnh endonuclease [Halorubrum coriense DSM 10284]|uniref:Hnh endonuclease n=1 Tax=Halorubrum coriense DSM 10284 TaxID=1227466 RepID=M0EP18_9EURY|nr:HNH endonuclease signature motif containing protein [Halorubrum coriense]ELZ48843.1 hnh endonuclease [Halorubrum coriense DSM 10284]